MKIFGTSILALVTAAGPLLADAHMDRDNMIRTRDITGGEIYSSVDPLDWDNDSAYDAVDDGWNDIGEIEDIILDKNGQMIGVIGEIGGFLDIGDKHVFMPVDNVRLVPVDDKTFAILTNMSEEQLEELPEMDEGFWD